MSAFLKFTDPDGGVVWIGTRWVTRIRQPIPNRHPNTAKAVIYMGNAEQAVCETVDQALSMLEGEADE